MSRNRLNLSGRWDGTYAYPGGVGPKTPFVAELAEEAGAVSGTIVEPNLMGSSSETLTSIVRGTRAGTAIDFTKTYDGASDAAHSVDYVGQLSADGTAVTGVWSLDQMDGTFEMHRQAAAEAPLESEAAETIEQP